MTEVSQEIKITCQNSIIKGAAAKAIDGGHPWRNWKIKLVAVDGQRERKGKLSALLDHVEYFLHPTFENPHRVFAKEPFTLQEKGWGEFDMRIVLYFTNNLANPEVISFDLNFSQSNYSVVHKVVFENPSPELITLLATDILIDGDGSSSSSSSGSGGGNGKRHAASSDLGGSGKKRRPSVSEKTMTKRTLTSPPIPSPAHLMPGASNSPLAPSFYSGKTVHNPSQSTYSASPPPPTFNSPMPIIPTSPYDFPFARTPQGYPSDNYLSDLSDDGRRSAPGGTPGEREENVTNGYGEEKSSEGEHETGGDVMRTNSNNDVIVDDIYNENDLENVNPIHRMPLDAQTREAWGIPEGVEILELARQLSNMTGDQIEEFYAIVRQHMTDDMTIEDNDGELVLDLYSLGPRLLTRLWEYAGSLGATMDATDSSPALSNHLNGYGHSELFGND
ncbi:hypothetical protein EC973_009245 [Apophysomyces ossiformis]|uniref:YEATS domain-containing protein n=1 Tax=Apophysomyces ossiformis TaxID=679940 RepID=A0A8H7BRL0_9FUNG|nr:hypothetical protein EC973_009245 [Apophysomyces ossiformis]